LALTADELPDWPEKRSGKFKLSLKPVMRSTISAGWQTVIVAETGLIV